MRMNTSPRPKTSRSPGRCSRQASFSLAALRTAGLLPFLQDMLRLSPALRSDHVHKKRTDRFIACPSFLNR